MRTFFRSSQCSRPTAMDLDRPYWKLQIQAPLTPSLRLGLARNGLSASSDRLVRSPNPCPPSSDHLLPLSKSLLQGSHHLRPLSRPFWDVVEHLRVHRRLSDRIPGICHQSSCFDLRAADFCDRKEKVLITRIQNVWRREDLRRRAP